MIRKSLIILSVIEMAGSSEITGQCRWNSAEKPENEKTYGIASKAGYIGKTGNHAKVTGIKKSKKQNGW